MKSDSFAVNVWQGLYFTFIVSLFLTFGAAYPEMFISRVLLGGVVLFFSLFLSLSLKTQPPHPGLLPQGGEGILKPRRWNFCFAALACVFAFEIVRALTAVYSLYFLHLQEPRFHFYLEAPLKWAFYFGFFSVTRFFFNSKARIWKLMDVLVWASLFLVANLIGPLLKTGLMGYKVGTQEYLFHPVFYKIPEISRFVLGYVTHSNYAGDLIGIGFFSGLGLVFYIFQSAENRNARHWTSLALRLTLMLLTGACILLLFSRGTMIFFAFSLVLFFAAFLVKFPKTKIMGSAILIFFLIFGFFKWAGNMNDAVKELVTLDKETTLKTGSLAHNQEGAARAMRMVWAYPVWGVGTDGYRAYARQYASPGGKMLGLADYSAICHYFQILANEGIGAYFYFIFLGAYFFEVLAALWATKSRFKFMAGTALLCIVVMILGHASIAFLMEQFPIALLVYIVMGASLAVLGGDFTHD